MGYDGQPLLGRLALLKMVSDLFTWEEASTLSYPLSLARSCVFVVLRFSLNKVMWSVVSVAVAYIELCGDFARFQQINFYHPQIPSLGTGRPTCSELNWFLI